MHPAAVLAAFVLAAGLLAWAVKPGRLLRALGRWLAGHHVRHGRMTDATWTRPATRVLVPRQVRPHWHRPGWHRTGRRVGWLALAVLALSAWLTGAWWLWALLGALAASGATVAAWLAVRALSRRRHRRAVVLPLRAATATLVGQSRTRNPDAWLDVPTAYATDPESPVTIALPQGFDRAAFGSQLESLALDRLAAMREPVVSWHNYGARPTVVVKARPAPPKRVTLADLAPAIRAASADALVLGMGAGERIVSVSLALDSPHVALSAPSNSGKSVAAALMVGQRLSRGANAVILDMKAESHTWAFGLPNVAVMTRAESVHSALVMLWLEVERRQRVVEETTRAGGERPEFPELWVIGEELNLTRRALGEAWTQYREEDSERAKTIPKSSPALGAIANISFAGRSVGVHCILVAQRLTAAATGDNTGAVRENMGIRYMIRPRPSTWAMLGDGAPFPRHLSKAKGRAFVIVDGQAEEVQGGYGTDAEYRELATSGDVLNLAPAWRQIEQGALFLPTAGEDTRELLDGGAADLPALPIPAPRRVTVAQAVADGILSGQPESLSRALHRDRQRGRAPEPLPGVAGNEYDPAELANWQAARPRAVKASGE